MRTKLYFCMALTVVWGAYTSPALLAAADLRMQTALDRAAVMSSLAEHGALLDVAAVQGRLIAVGERGHVLLSDDDGQGWMQVAMPVAVTLTAVDFVDGQTGWAVGHGGVVVQTLDGGRTWRRQTDGRALSYAFAEAEHAARERGDGLLVEKLRRFIDDGADKPLLDVLFLDARRGYAVGAYGLMLSTEDGGNHWTVASALLESDEDRHIYAIRKLGDALYLVGEQGLLYRSSDGGTTFSRMESPADGSWFGMVGTGEERMLLGLRGALWHSDDGGAHWRQLKIDTKYSFVAGLALDAGKGYLFADDGGGVWHLDGEAGAPHRLEASARFPLASLALAADGSVVASGLLGTLRIAVPGL